MSKIIAEIGVNWSGDLEIAKEMIVQSKIAGADFVKFQLFNKDVIKDSKYKNELSEMILDFSTLNKLRGYAFQNHIDFGISVMYPEVFDFIRNLGVPADFLKIRCKDRDNVTIARLAVKYCNDADIPLLISTERPVSGEDYYRYNLYNTEHAKYLYCVPKYPPELNEIYDSYVGSDYFEGFSSHYPSPYFPMVAVSRNCEFVEIHVKRPEARASTMYEPGLQIDSNVSIDFEDLKLVCDLNKLLSQMR